MEYSPMNSDDQTDLELMKVSKAIIRIPMRILSFILLFVLLVTTTYGFFRYWGVYSLCFMGIFILATYILFRIKRSFCLSHKTAQTWKIVPGIFLILITLLPVYKSFTMRHPIIDTKLPKEILELPYRFLPLDSSKFMIPDTKHSIHFTIGKFESVKGLWAGDE